MHDLNVAHIVDRRRIKKMKRKKLIAEIPMVVVFDNSVTGRIEIKFLFQSQSHIDGLKYVDNIVTCRYLRRGKGETFKVSHQVSRHSLHNWEEVLYAEFKNKYDVAAFKLIT